VKNSVDLEKALSDMLKYLKTLKKNQSEGVVLLSYDPEPIICLLNSIVKFDELKLIFIDLVKGLGNLRAYLELGPSENTVGEYTPEAIKSLHSAGLVVLGDVTKEVRFTYKALLNFFMIFLVLTEQKRLRQQCHAHICDSAAIFWWSRSSNELHQKIFPSTKVYSI